MPGLLVNIDVPDPRRGLDFDTAALGLRIGRRFADGGVVELLGADAAIARATRAGAVREGATAEAPSGRLAPFADPFGHGSCLVEFNRQGYDAVAKLTPRRS